MVQTGGLQSGTHSHGLFLDLNFDGLDFGRRVLGSSTAAGPSVLARFRNS
jgi:hypothetical protein